MKIIKITSQHRRDFSADMECESCGHREKLTSGYDDRNYHDNVIPAMKCGACRMSRNDLGIEQSSTPTKYADWETI